MHILLKFHNGMFTQCNATNSESNRGKFTKPYDNEKKKGTLFLQRRYFNNETLKILDLDIA